MWQKVGFLQHAASLLFGHILGKGQEKVLCIHRRFRHMACRVQPVKPYLHLKQQVRTTSKICEEISEESQLMSVCI